MNVTPRTIQAQPANGASQPNAAAAAAAPGVDAKSQDFARALNDAGEKPGRKSAVNKADAASQAGQQLPAAGKHPPAPLPPQAAVIPQQRPPALLPLPPAGPLPSAAASKPDGATDELSSALVPAAVAAPATGVAAADDDGALNTDTVARNPAGTLMAPTASGEFGGLLDANGLPRAAASRFAVGDAKAAVPKAAAPTAAASGDDEDDATAALSTPAGADTVDTAQTLMAAALAHVSGALSDPGPAAGSQASEAQAAGIQAAGVQAADSAAADQQLTRQESAPISSAAILVAAQLAARPAVAEAAAEAADALATATAKLISVHAPSSTDGAAGPAQAANATTAATGTAPPPLKVAADVGSAGFGQDLAAQVSLMVDNNLSSAKLQVNPPSLGPIEVRIALQDGHAQVWLTSHSALTRDALESSSPNLREMLSSQGFGQVSVDVSQRSFHQDRSPQSQSYDSKPVFERNEISASSQSSGSSTRAALGIVDAYA